jgi:single-strand DNA-binding protein
MSTLNKVFLMGRLTRDPELRYTPQGIPVSDLGLAVNRSFTPSAGGEKKEETLFIDVTVWRKQAELCCQYLRKGSPVFIEGRLSMDTWEKDGKKNTRIRVIAENFQFIGGTGAGKGGGGEPPPTPEADESGRPAGDYGASYRRPAGGAGGESWSRGGAQAAPPSSVPPPEAPPGEDYTASREEDIPF